MPRLRITGIRTPQSSRHTVVSFHARPEDIHRIASIDRIGRSERGELSGFQRPQIASHIREIRDYLMKQDSVLPNPIVVAFTDGVYVTPEEGDIVTLEIDVANGPIGTVVDGQQRLSAATDLGRPGFHLLVSALICPDVEELRRQFVLINNTRPLPKSLIYELLPTVSGLPTRLTSRTFAARLTARLNYESSSLTGHILQHTNPTGVIRDTAIQKVVMNSTSDGALRELMHFPDGEETSFQLISAFFGAVQEVFHTEWFNHTPKTSRLVHGAGIVAMGYVMETLYFRDGARRRAEFVNGLRSLEGKTAWTRGTWHFADDDIRPWNRVQNTRREIAQLAEYLIHTVKAGRDKVPAKASIDVA